MATALKDEQDESACTASTQSLPEQEDTDINDCNNTIDEQAEFHAATQHSGAQSLPEQEDYDDNDCNNTIDEQGDFHAGNSLHTTTTEVTLMVHHLPDWILQQDLMDMLNSSGFDGLYDFVFVPASFDTGKGKGYGFVNFKTAEAAHALRKTWKLRVGMARIQGREANIQRWNTRKMGRVRNSNFRPLIWQQDATQTQ